MPIDTEVIMVLAVLPSTSALDRPTHCALHRVIVSRIAVPR
jgi:hypothetical protein